MVAIGKEKVATENVGAQTVGDAAVTAILVPRGSQKDVEAELVDNAATKYPVGAHATAVSRSKSLTPSGLGHEPPSISDLAPPLQPQPATSPELPGTSPVCPAESHAAISTLAARVVSAQASPESNQAPPAPANKDSETSANRTGSQVNNLNSSVQQESSAAVAPPVWGGWVGWVVKTVVTEAKKWWQ